MTRPAEWTLSVLAAAAFSAIWVVAVAVEMPGTFADVDAMLIFWAFTATPGVFAARLLIRATRPAESAVDGPARLLGAVTSCQAEGGREWGAAMLAELAAVSGRGARWRFAAGCARVTLVPPRDGRAWIVAAAAVPAAGVVAALVLPAMTVFAVTFTAILAATTPHLPRRPSLTGVVGLTACLTIVGYMVAAHPSSAAALTPVTAVVLAILLAAGGRLALVPPRRLTGDRLAWGVGVGAAVVLGTGFLLASRLPGEDASGMLSYVIFLPIPVFFVGAAVTAAVRGSFRAGVRTAVWTALVGTACLFVLWLLESVRWYHEGMGLLLDGDGLYTIGVNLGDAIVWTLAWLPVWGLPIGVLGAAAGRWLGSRRTRVRGPGVTA